MITTYTNVTAIKHFYRSSTFDEGAALKTEKVPYKWQKYKRVHMQIADAQN